MKVAAYQAPLLRAGAFDAVELIRAQVCRCEVEGISVLCCPEAILGGLADYSDRPCEIAIRVNNAQLDEVLAPVASDSVTSIIGFTELGDDDRLYNTAAVFQRGRVSGLYRKLHPAIRKSVYSPGTATPVFQLDGMTFGVVICHDSNFPELARLMAGQGATVLFVPTNNGLPSARAGPGLVQQARKSDIDRAVENRVWVVRADVVGTNGELTSYGASGIIDPQGHVLAVARPNIPDLIVAELSAQR